MRIPSNHIKHVLRKGLPEGMGQKGMRRQIQSPLVYQKIRWPEYTSQIQIGLGLLGRLNFQKLQN